MKYLTHAASILICCGAFSTSAKAAEKTSLQMSPNEVQNLVNGLSALDGFHRVAKGPQGQDQDVLSAYDIPGSARLTIAHDDAVIQAYFADYRRAAKGLTGDKLGELMDVKQTLDLLTIDVKDLNVDRNPYPPSALAALAPVCPSCIDPK